MLMILWGVRQGSIDARLCKFLGKRYQLEDMIDEKFMVWRTPQAQLVWNIIILVISGK
jgi:hypothetical protein